MAGFLKACINWVDTRYEVNPLWRYMRGKSVPLTGHATIWYYFGGVSLFLFVVQIVTGMLLVLYYQPGEKTSYESVQFITSEVEFGWLIRSTHAWAGHLMILCLFVHMFSVYFTRSYRKPRELTWFTGLALMGLGFCFGFSGYLLPWTKLSLFATKVGTEIPAVFPLIGEPIKQLLRSGEDVSGATLTRFFGVHVAVLPLVFLAVLGLHLIMIQRQGMSPPMTHDDDKDKKKKDGDDDNPDSSGGGGDGGDGGDEESGTATATAEASPESSGDGEKKKDAGAKHGKIDLVRNMPFFPHFVLRDGLLWLVVLNVLALLAVFLPSGTEIPGLEWHVGPPPAELTDELEVVETQLAADDIDETELEHLEGEKRELEGELARFGKADPFAPAYEGIKPEWYFIATYQALKVTPLITDEMRGLKQAEAEGRQAETIGPLGLEWAIWAELMGLGYFGFLALIFAAVPFWDRWSRKGKHHWVVDAYGHFFLANLVFFTMWGMDLPIFGSVAIALGLSAVIIIGGTVIDRRKAAQLKAFEATETEAETAPTIA